MKSVFFAFALMVLTVSCESSSTSEVLTTTESTNLSPSKRTLTVTEVIDAVESPDVTLITTLPFSMTQDLTRNVILDINSSVVKVPINFTGTIPGDIAVIGFNIKIAKKYPKPGNGCSSCVDCIGFRCKPNKANVLTQMPIADAESDAAARRILPLTSVREHNCIVIIRKNSKVAEFYPMANVDWQNLAANE